VGGGGWGGGGLGGSTGSNARYAAQISNRRRSLEQSLRWSIPMSVG
jgi:hypothetical protein